MLRLNPGVAHAPWFKWFMLATSCLAMAGCKAFGEPSPRPEPSTLVVVNFLEYSITDIAVAYGDQRIEFRLPYEDSLPPNGTISRWQIHPLPEAGQTMTITYRPGPTRREVLVPDRPRKPSVPVVVLLEGDAVVEWRFAGEELSDTTDDLRRRYGGPELGNEF